MPKDESIIKGNMSQSINNTRSTTTNNNSREEQTHTDPIREQNNGKTELVMSTVYETHKIYTDQTGKFPMTSSWGNKFVLTLYVCYDNSILTAPLESRSVIHILETYTKQLEQLNYRGYRPRVHWLDI